MIVDNLDMDTVVHVLLIHMLLTSEPAQRAMLHWQIMLHYKIMLHWQYILPFQNHSTLVFRLNKGVLLEYTTRTCPFDLVTYCATVCWVCQTYTRRNVLFFKWVSIT